MDRRQFLKIGASASLGAFFPVVAQSKVCRSIVVSGGWSPDLEGIKRFVFKKKIQNLKQRASISLVGSGKGRVVLLHKYLEKAIGELVPHFQEIGDCVGQAFGLGTDVLAATQIHGLGLAEEFKAKASTEVAYAGSRYEIGFLEHGNTDILRFDGSWGGYAAEFIKTYGMLPRGVYGNIDLTKYDPRLARLWGKEGIPDHLEPQIKQHPIRSYALVSSYADCRDAIANGYPIIFCSSVGFNPDCKNCNPGGRDEMGFLHRCGTWYHAMCGTGVDDTNRPGILIHNSWGKNWVLGGIAHEQPVGSFWADAENIDSMCSMGDSYAISGFLGFPSVDLDYHLF